MYYQIRTGGYAPTLRSLVEKKVPIFNDWWDTYLPEHKKELETKIIRHYYFEEIGCDTPDQFIFRLNEQLARIMPYYNQLYASELIKFNPMLNHYMESNGRSIENLVSRANTANDKYAKAIREFAGITDRTSEDIRNAIGTANEDTHNVGVTGYGKSGEEHGTTHDVENGTQDVISHETKVTDGTVHTDETETTNSTTTKDTDGKKTENPGEVSTKKMDWGQTETGKETMTGKEDSDETKTDHWIETIDDDSTTKTVTSLKETTTETGDKGYADTPQKLIIGGEEKIRKDYLTNYTWTDTNSVHNADTTQDQTYADDQTKEHTGEMHDLNVTNKSSTTDLSKSKGGSDTETTSKSGQNVVLTDDTETTTVNGTKKTLGDVDTDETVTSDGTQNTTTSDTADGKADKDWKEGGSEDREETGTKKANSTSDSKANFTGTDQVKENADVTQTAVENQEKNTTETTDTGKTDFASGYMNVSASALLEAFRRTFLNIDEMIIKELRENFMCVY